MVLSDGDIRKLCLAPLYYKQHPMISPFSEPVSGDGIISYGLTSGGYDLRLAGDVMIFKNSYGHVVNPKMFKDENYRKEMFDEITGLSAGHGVIIPAHGYILGRSFEYLCIPKNLKGRCVGKSTYARCGIIINVTPLEPEWEGSLTIEISNSSPCPAMVFVGEGIAQLEFEQLSTEPEQTYATKGGKYQGQVGVTPAKVV